MEFREGNFTLENVRAYIKFAENFLFAVPGGKKTEFSKMNAAFSGEDFLHGRDVRRPKFNPIYFAEELRSMAGAERGNCLAALNEIEEKIFLSSSYEHEISGEDLISLICDVLYLSNLIEQEIDFIERKIPDTDYEKAAKQFPALQPPDMKHQFILCLKDLAACLKDQIPQYAGLK